MYVSFIGNLTSDAREVVWKDTDGEKKRWLSFCVAETTFRGGEKGTEFIECESKLFAVFKFLTKGKRVSLCGDAAIERKEREDGSQIVRMKVFAYDIKLL